MAAGGPVTELLAAQAAAATGSLLAGHHVDAAAEGGGRGEEGGSLTYLTRDRKVKPGGRRSRLRSRKRKPSGESLGSSWRLLSPSHSRSRPERPKNQINFPGQKAHGLFAPRCQLIPHSLPYNHTNFGQYISLRIKFRVPILGKKMPKNDENSLFGFFSVLYLSTTDFSFILFDDRNKDRKNGGKCCIR